MSRSAVAASILLAVSCTRGGLPGAAEKRLATRSGRVELTFPGGWSQEAETPFDLQALSPFGRASTGVFEFSRGDLAADVTPRQVLDLQIDDIRSKRKNFVPIAEETKVEERERTLTTRVFRGEKDASRYDYRFTLVEFPAHPDIFLVVLQVAAPSEWARSVPAFDAILRSAKVRGNGGPVHPAPAERVEER